MLYKIGVLKNVTKFSRKHLCRSLLMIKWQAKICKNTFLVEQFLVITSVQKQCSRRFCKKVVLKILAKFTGKHLYRRLCSVLSIILQQFRIVSKFPFKYQAKLNESVNPLSANPTKWSNTLKQFVGKS